MTILTIPHVTLGFALLLTGCGEGQVASPKPLSSPDPEQEKYRSFVAEARRLETEADVLLTVDGTRGEHSVRLLRPSLPSHTNELSTAADFQALASALPQHDTAVIRLWAFAWNNNRVTNAAAQLRQAGFRSIRATAMGWGESTPGPEL